MESLSLLCEYLEGKKGTEVTIFCYLLKKRDYFLSQTDLFHSGQLNTNNNLFF